MFKSGKAKLLLLFIILGGFILYMNAPDDRRPKETTTGPKTQYTLEKTGAGTVADYTAAAQRIHVAVDSGLAGAKLTAQGGQETRREVPNKAVEGTIRWHARQLLVTGPGEVRPEAVQQALAGSLRNVGEVLDSQADTYQGQPVVRVDVGLHDTLAGDQITLITDRIYIPRPKRAETQPAGQGRLAVIIDDFGYGNEAIGAFAAMPRPVTFAVIPYHQFSNEAASRALSAGQQVILHLPMEPLSTAEQSEATTVTVAMTDQEIRDTVTKAVNAVPGIIGVNNHQGSKATADRRVMRTTLTILKANNLFFVDSRTNGQSIAFDTAKQLGMRSGSNELFLDNKNDVDYVKGQLRTAIRLAIQNGSAIVIGHARMTTATALREMIPEIEAAGVKLVFASQLVK